MKGGRMREQLSFYRGAGSKGGMGQAVGEQLLCSARAEMKYKAASEKVASGAEFSPSVVTARLRQQVKLSDLGNKDWFVDRSGVRYNIISVVSYWSLREIEIHAERV